MKVFRINDIILFYCYLCKTRNWFLVRSIIFQSFEQGSEWLVSQPHAAAVLLTEGLKSQPSQRLIADGSMWKSAYSFSFVSLIVAHPHLLFSRLNFIDFWGAASVHFLLLNFLAGFYCTLSYKLSSAPLTLSSPVSPLLCAHTQKIHPLFSNEKKNFLDLISIEGGRPIVNKTLEPLLYCSPVYDFIWLSFLPFRVN